MDAKTAPPVPRHLRRLRRAEGRATAGAAGRAGRQAGGGHSIRLMEASAAGRCNFIKTFRDTDDAFLTGACALSTNKSLYEIEPS